MKKILLSISALLLSYTMSTAQVFTQAADNSGFTYDCENKEDAAFLWQGWYPQCSLSGSSGDGGYSEAATKVLDFGWGQGISGYVYGIFLLTTPLNLSSAANQKISVDLKSDDGTNALPLTYTLRLEDISNNSLLDETATLNVTGTTQTFNIDLSSHLASGKDLSSVKKIIFLYSSCPSSAPVSAAHLRISNFNAGSYASTPTSVNDELLSRISDAKLYPNPASSTATVELALKTSSKVKVVVSDVLGNSVRTLEEQNTDAYAASFDVSNLSSGIYYVSYQIDGTPVKTEKLVIN